MANAAPPSPKKSNLPMLVVMGCGVLLLLAMACGVVSAIAIPSFTRYQQKAARQQPGEERQPLVEAHDRQHAKRQKAGDEHVAVKPEPGP